MIYVFLAEGFEEIEALTPVDLLRRAEEEVVLVGVGDRFITGAHNITVVCDAADYEVAPSADMQAIVLPGGMPGTLNLEHSETVQSFIRFANEHNILICAICAAPSVLGHLGLLNGKTATCFPGFEAELTGAKLTDAPVCRDGQIITAEGMGAATEFGLEIAAALHGKAEAEHLRKTIRSR